MAARNIMHAMFRLRANWITQLFTTGLLSALVGFTLQITKLSALDSSGRQYDQGTYAGKVGFLAVFGLSKAFANLSVGWLVTRLGYVRTELAGWLLGLAMPLLVAGAAGGPGAGGWRAVVAANVVLGLQQGLCWSVTVLVMILLLPASRRGLASGLNETLGYAAVAAAAPTYGVLEARMVRCGWSSPPERLSAACRGAVAGAEAAVGGGVEVDPSTCTSPDTWDPACLGECRCLGYSQLLTSALLVLLPTGLAVTALLLAEPTPSPSLAAAVTPVAVAATTRAGQCRTGDEGEADGHLLLLPGAAEAGGQAAGGGGGLRGCGRGDDGGGDGSLCPEEAQPLRGVSDRGDWLQRVRRSLARAVRVGSYGVSYGSPVARQEAQGLLRELPPEAPGACEPPLPVSQGAGAGDVTAAGTRGEHPGGDRVFVASRGAAVAGAVAGASVPAPQRREVELEVVGSGRLGLWTGRGASRPDGYAALGGGVGESAGAPSITSWGPEGPLAATAAARGGGGGGGSGGGGDAEGLNGVSGGYTAEPTPSPPHAALGPPAASASAGPSSLPPQQQHPEKRVLAGKRQPQPQPPSLSEFGRSFLYFSWHNGSTAVMCLAGLLSNTLTSLAWGLLLTWARDDLGVPGPARNLITASYSFLKGLVQLLSGAVSDTAGRKGPVVVGLMLNAAGLLTCACGAGWGGALLGAAVPPAQRPVVRFGYLLLGSCLMGAGAGVFYPVMPAAVVDHTHVEGQDPVGEQERGQEQGCAGWSKDVGGSGRERAEAEAGGPGRGRGSLAAGMAAYRFWRDLGYAAGAVGGPVADMVGVEATLVVAAGLCLLVSGAVVVKYRERPPGPADAGAAVRGRVGGRLEA